MRPNDTVTITRFQAGFLVPENGTNESRREAGRINSLGEMPTEGTRSHALEN